LLQSNQNQPQQNLNNNFAFQTGNLSQSNQQQTTSSLASLQSLLLQNNNNLILNRNIFNSNQSGGQNPPPSSLSNSFSLNKSTAGLASSIDSRNNNLPFANYFNQQNPSNMLLLDHISTFNNQNNLVNNSSMKTPPGYNQNQIYNLNESFDNPSIFDDSFKFYLNHNLLPNNINTHTNNKQSNDSNTTFLLNNSDEINQLLLLNDEDDEDEDLDFVEYAFLNSAENNNKAIKSDREIGGVNNNVVNGNNPKLSRHQSILKLYEEEEKKIALEIRQDKQLLSVLEQEVKLTKQLSAEEKFIHYNQQFQKLKSGLFKNEDEEDEENEEEEYENNSNSKLSTDCDTTERNTPLNAFGNYDFDSDQNKSNNNVNRTPQGGKSSTSSSNFAMHEKLLLLSRKQSPNERRRKHEEKQARAQEKREQFYQERLNKLKELTKKIQEVNELKKKLLKAKKVSMKAKLERAEEKRQYLLSLKAAKASVEEQKAHEIAFINSLAAQNRKQDILEKYEKRHEIIKHNLEEERLRKQEEQKAKEQAAEVKKNYFIN
jgi:hypothetical protein